MLMRTDPFQELDRFADQVFGPSSRPVAMPMDAYRKDDHFVVHFDLPGVDPASIELTVEKNMLAVAAERRWDTDGAQVMASERPQGTYSRHLYLGDSLDADRVEASYDNGVLTVTIPVTPRAKARRIAIGSRDTGAKAIEANSAVA